MKNKIPSINGLATTAALTAVENEILDVSNLVKKADYDAKNIRHWIQIFYNITLSLVEYNKFITNFNMGRKFWESFKVFLTFPEKWFCICRLDLAL